MNIEEILSRLERIDHKEYSCGFEFADSSTFDEMARCYEERKILAKEIERIEKENERYRIAINEMALIINKAIEYIENEMPCLWEVDDVWEDIDGNYQHNYKEYDYQVLLDILKGEDE